MIKRGVIVLCTLFCLLSCGKKTVFRLEGNLSNLKDQTIYAVFEGPDKRFVDTIKCEKNGRFHLIREQVNFSSVTLLFEHKSRWITLYPESGEKVSLSGDIQIPELLEIKGGDINDKLTAFYKGQSSLIKERALLQQKLNAEPDSLVTDETTTTSKLINVNHQLQEKAESYIRKNPSEAASVVLIYRFFRNNEDTRLLDEFLALLEPSLKDFFLVKELESFTARAKRTAIGAEAPGFDLKNIYNQPVSLDSFANKYLLLSFTAPWCEMCQTDNLYLDDIKREFPKDKVDMLLISLDTDQTQVRKIVNADTIKWNLVTDSAGQATTMLELYNVTALPRCFLIDNEGKIILKTDNGLEVKKLLEQVFKK